jgi:hypothetical protein
MALAQSAVDLYRELQTDPAFHPGASICDLGAQIMHVDPNFGLSAGPYVQKMFGFGRYVCIDMDGTNNALDLDLNNACYEDVGEQFDVVTNHGTTEHCLNQLNCFRFMHDITKVGGLMIHMVPSWPYCDYNNCFFFMTEEVFSNVAEANNYEKVRLNLFDDSNGKYVLAVLRRTSDAKFIIPIQRYYHLPNRKISVSKE